MSSSRRFCPGIKRTTTAEGCERRRSLGACLCRKERDKDVGRGKRGSDRAQYKAELDVIIASCVRDNMDYDAISKLVDLPREHVGTRVYRMRKMGILEAAA